MLVPIMDAYVVYNGSLRYHMFSKELPPLISVNGAKARTMINILRREFGSVAEDGTEVVNLKPFTAPAVMVWIVASIATKPSRDLLRALMSYTPRSAIDLIFELVDTSKGYSTDTPLLPRDKLVEVSRTVLKILELHGYPTK